MIAVSSRIMPPRDRFEFWCDLVNRQLAPMRTEPIVGCPFRGDMRAQMVGDVPVAELFNGGSRSSRTRQEIARTRDHCYFLAVHLDGAACLSYRDEHIVLRRGDIMFGDTMHEFTIGLQQTARQLVIKLPTHWIESRVARPDSLGCAVWHDGPLAPLLAAYLAHGFEMAEQLSPAAATMFAQHVVELTAQAIEEAPGSQPTPSKAWRDALFVRANQLIALRFGEPALTPECIARSLGVSTRLLQRIFAEHDATVMARVWEERVRRAAELLAAPAAAHRSITEIAFACGFNDSAHFTRAFVARMAATPSHWRRDAHERALDGDTAALVNGGERHP
jgi:AraC family transcriptional regulator, positive regulator of tynA and feaB